MPHPPTHSQKRVTPTHIWPKKGHIHPHPALKKVIPIHTQPKNGPTHPNPVVKLWKRRSFIIHQLIKFIRNSRSPKYNFCKVLCLTISILIQYWTNDKSAGVINNFSHILTKNYLQFIFNLPHFHFTSSYNILFFFYHVYYFVLSLLQVYYFVNCTYV